MDHGIEWVEDLIYALVALLLAAVAVVALVGAVTRFLDLGGDADSQVLLLDVLDLLLLVFIVVELLYAVRTTIKRRELLAEPFLLVGIIASINQNHPVCKVARAGLLRANSGDRELVRAMETVQLECTPRVTGLTPFLAMLGNLGTLLGLIGTVFGMIHAFEGLGVSDSGAKQEILARGIALAMNATAIGLIVAIPGTFFATLFNFRQEKLVDQMEEVSLTISGAIGQAQREAKLRQQQQGR